ncbi:MAG: GNAT family N-acetyltransferase, partial [Longimicrobiales bacterium]
MSLGPTLVTPRLILRPPTQEDFDGFASMAKEEDTMRFIGGVAPRDMAWRGLATMTGAWALLGFSMFSVLERETGEWIGRLGPWRPGGKQGGWPGDEVGWGLKRAAMGKGYAAEGATV